MALILHIDTALTFGSVSIAENGKVLLGLENKEAQDHAAFVQPAIRQLLKELSLEPGQLDAIAAVAGPGSYTGLRVGLASAKGLCYALQKPLLMINTLNLMAASAIKHMPGFDWYCPMIDARRDEVFTALYNAAGKEGLTPRPMVLQNDCLDEIAAGKAVLFFGNGAKKAKIILNNNPSWTFTEHPYSVKDICEMGFKCFINRDFRDLAYAEPFYLKEFYLATHVKKRL